MWVLLTSSSYTLFLLWIVLLSNRRSFTFEGCSYRLFLSCDKRTNVFGFYWALSSMFLWLRIWWFIWMDGGLNWLMWFVWFTWFIWLTWLTWFIWLTWLTWLARLAWLTWLIWLAWLTWLTWLIRLAWLTWLTWLTW